MLNNKGWGMSLFILFIVGFIIFLVIASIISYKMGLNQGNDNLNINTNNSVTSYDYTTLETKLKNAAISYVKQRELNINVGQTIIVTYDELTELNVINNLQDKIGNCTGYVKISYDGSIFIYNPFIKCVGRYQTSGY